MLYLNSINKYSKDLNKYSNQHLQMIYIVCKMWDQNNINFDLLLSLSWNINQMLSKVPTKEVDIHVEITDDLTNLMVDVLKNNKIEMEDRKYFEIYFATIENYYNASRLLSMLGIPGLAWEYIILALNPLRDKNEMGLYVPLQIWKNAMENRIEGARETALVICSNYFYLSKILGHNKKDCSALFNDTVKWLQLGELATEDDIEYLIFFAEFLKIAFDENLGSDIYGKLCAQYKIEVQRNSMNAYKITHTLTGIAELMGENCIYWAQESLRIMEKYNINIPGAKADLQLTILLNLHYFDKTKVYKVLLDYLDYLIKDVKDIIVIGLLKQKTSYLLNRCISSFLGRNEYELAFECAYLWRTFNYYYKDEKGNGEIYLLAIPNYKDSHMCYILKFKEKYQYFEFPRNIQLEQLLKIKNEFEGTWTVLTDGDNSEDIYSGSGFPNKHNSKNYYNFLKEFYKCEEIASKIKLLNSKEKIRIYEVPWINTPIEAMIGQHINGSISTLIEGKSLDQSQIKKVLIWSDPDSSLPISELEKGAVLHILKSKENIDLEIYSNDECSRELFIEKYRDSDFDLIYLMCHGNFNFDNPSASELFISKDDTIQLNELIENMPKRDAKRLLVLNACQTGSSSIRYTGMNFIGFGPSLTNQYQSIIGHLWPVLSIDAMIFGIMLTYYLAESKQWGDAINFARKDLLLNKHDLVDKFIKQLELPYDSDLIRILEKETVKLNELISWGSSCLFE